MTLVDSPAPVREFRETPAIANEPASAREAAWPCDSLISALDPFDPRCERIRVLRTELLLRRESLDQADVIALLSPSTGEGRSVLAADLAIAFAQTGRDTLLVDADLRNPQQHVLFNIRNRLGLAQAIEHGALPPVHEVKGLARLSVLTAGQVPGNPLELLSSATFAAMFAGWRKCYRFVVIDTAPATPFSDALAVASMAGRVLVLSRAQVTRYRDMQVMLRRLAATRSQILGSVLSHF